MFMTHVEARRLIISGFAHHFGRLPSRSEAQCAQAVGWAETNYGMGWGEGAGRGSNNWGAITTGRRWLGDSFDHKDSRPNRDGTNTWYTTAFRAYDTAADGAADLVRQVYLVNIPGRGDRRTLVLPPATAGDLLLFATRMYVTGYYGGFGASDEQRIEGYFAKLHAACILQARALKETMPDGSEAPPPPPPTLRLGSRGDGVLTVQVIVGATPLDGIFGKKTLAAVCAWQQARHLKVDGIWGPVCWAQARKEGLIA